MPEITCPNCRERLDVPVELMGTAIRCGSCQNVIEPGEAPRPYPRPEPPRRPREDYREDPRFSDEPPRKKGSLTWLWLLLGCGGISCLGCCGGVGFLGWKVENPTWTKYTDPNGKFTFEYPGEVPVTQTRPVPVPDGKPMTMTMLASERKIAQEAYFVGYCDLPKDDGPIDKAMAEQLLNASLDGAKKPPNGATVKEVRRTNMTLYNQPAKEFVGDYSDPQIKKGRLTMRVFILNERLYLLMVMGKDNGPSTEKVEKFFSSFTPTDEKKGEKIEKKAGEKNDKFEKAK